MKVFALRFDIDTPKCLAEGVPPLIDLAEAHGVRFSFYLTVGRSVSIPNFLAARFSGKAGEPSAAALSARQKLGWRDYLYTALVNPKIGPTFRNIVHRLAASQELGLHGGRNHELWHHQSPTWSHEKTKDEVQWAVDWLRKEGFPVKGFSSPGWTSPPDLAQVLAEAGFKYRADRHGEGAVGCVQEGPLLNVGTNFTGEPGGTGVMPENSALQARRVFSR